MWQKDIERFIPQLKNFKKPEDLVESDVFNGTPRNLKLETGLDNIEKTWLSTAKYLFLKRPHIYQNERKISKGSDNSIKIEEGSEYTNQDDELNEKLKEININKEDVNRIIKNLEESIRIKNFISYNKIDCGLEEMVNRLKGMRKNDGIMVLKEKIGLEDTVTRSLVDLMIAESKMQIFSDVDRDGFSVGVSNYRKEYYRKRK